MIQQAPCRKCGAHLEFDAELIGTSATCPHCGEETLLSAPRSSRRGALALGLVVAVLALCVVATTILARHRHAASSTTIQTSAPPVANQSPLEDNPPSSSTAISNSQHRLLQPITGAFGYTLGVKLPEALTIDSDHTFTSDTTNYRPFEEITVRCVRDRRICTITGTSEDDNHAAIEQDFETQYGQGELRKAKG